MASLPPVPAFAGAGPPWRALALEPGGPGAAAGTGAAACLAASVVRGSAGHAAHVAVVAAGSLPVAARGGCARAPRPRDRAEGPTRVVAACAAE